MSASAAAATRTDRVELRAAGVVLGRSGSGSSSRLVRRRGLVVLGLVAEAELVAAAARVVAEERLRDERLLGQREVAAVAALGLPHVLAPDVGRERAAVDVARRSRGRSSACGRSG